MTTGRAATGPVTAQLPMVSKPDGIELAIRVVPRAGRNAVEGVTQDAAGTPWLAVKVTAPPDGGRANEAVLALLAKALKVPRSACRLVAGATGRWKRVHVSGDAAALAEGVAALAAGMTSR